MGEPLHAKILILAHQQASARRWAEMLTVSGAEVWLAAAEMPQETRPDVVVTDGNLSGDPGLTQSPTGSPPTIIGVVRIGGAGPADVRLPDDVTARELRLACRLLAQIVRLRRREHRGTALRRQLAEEALTDPLTGLPNRRAWQRALQERLAAAADSPHPAPQRLCLAILDLDHFKRVNDAHGHAAGDGVLRAAGRAVCHGLRQEDFVARLGGDEFGLLLWVPDEPTAAAVVDRVRAAVPSRLSRANTHVVTASAGYCLASTNDASTPPPSPEILYTVAAQALHEAKRQGRDRSVGA